MSDIAIPKRPKYLNLIKIRLPLPGFVSFLHRVSGAVLILALLFATWALDVALQSEQGYQKVADVMANPVLKLFALITIWSLFHHLCAGIRFLFLEAHIGVNLPAARLSSIIVILVSLALTLAVGAVVLL